ncbi:hypothetical protein [Candidatus Nitrospira salsa]
MPDSRDHNDRTRHWPPESSNARKQAAYASVEKPIEAAYWLYQAMSKTLAIKCFATAHGGGFQNDMENQRNWNDVVIRVQEIK